MEDSWMFRVAGAIDDSIQPSEEFCPDWYQGQGFDRFYLRSGRFGYVVGSWALAGYRNVSTTGQWTGSGGGGGRSGGSGGSGGGGGFAGGGAGAGGGGGW
jgi:hypothetical protein